MAAQLIRALLEQDISGARQLATLLEEERQLLEQRDVTALDRLLTRKAGLLAALEKNDQARHRHLKEAGHAADRRGLQAFCTQLDARQASPESRDGAPLLPLCSALSDALARCRELTSINANIVHRSRHNNSRLLNLLRGKDPATEVYDRSGTAGTRPGNRTLGSA